MIHLPEEFIKNIKAVHDDGEEWLAALPQTLAEVAARYDLTLGEPFQLSYSYVCAATRADGTSASGTPVVLKLRPPNDDSYIEVAALRHYGMDGCVKYLDADPDAGVVILERIFPGETLHQMALEDDEQATRIVADVMQKLWKPLPAEHEFPTVAMWATGLQELRDDHNGSTGPLPAHLVERAEALYRELLASAAAPVLLHGDLHHDNILTATRAPYLAIDPQGVAGEPAYEVGPFFYNPQPEIFRHPNLRQIFERRLAIFAECLQIDRERLHACAFAHCVLSAAWCVDENDDGWQETAYLAEILLQL